MSDTPYINLDLETAERLVIAAGKPELAEALNFHAHGVRNLVQGEWGQSFVNSLEGLLKTHIAPLTAEISGLRTEVAARLGKNEADIVALQSVVADHDTRLATFENEIAADIQQRLASLESGLVRFESIEASLAALVARIGGALPTEADQDLSARLRRASYGT